MQARICWVKQVENEERLRQTMLRRKLGFCGHVMQTNGMEKEMMLANGEGKRKQGKPNKGIDGFIRSRRELK
jgi:hypothetical protein